MTVLFGSLIFYSPFANPENLSVYKTLIEPLYKLLERPYQKTIVFTGAFIFILLSNPDKEAVKISNVKLS